MLIRGVEIWGHGPNDIRIEGGRISAIGQLATRREEFVIEGNGGLLIPGLHDHHIHLAALAVRQSSVICGPPEVSNKAELEERLKQSGEGWIRGVAYHESVMGLPQATELDAIVSHRPLRIQHRGGRMWLLNSLAMDELLARAHPPPGMEREGGKFTGHLFDEDEWLRNALAGTPPPFAMISTQLASMGVTGFTDMSPRNDPVMASHFSREIENGGLAQRCWLAGGLSLAEATSGLWHIGPAKLHLHETALPDFDEAVAFVLAGHNQKRAAAIHCTTKVELVFALAVLAAAGAHPGDRIEHASVASPHSVAEMAQMGVRVCVQPHFIVERGAQYLTDVEPRDLPDLYRLSSLAQAGIALVGGSDAPFGSADPWQAMAAAVGRSIGADEALTPETALALYLADPEDLGQMRHIEVGVSADLCLLSCPWAVARERLSAHDVRATILGGNLIYQTPA